MKIVAIIPSFNEEKTIIDVLKETGKHADKIIVVDSSTDSTPDLIEQNFPSVLLIRERKGKGNQIRRGVKETRKYNPDYVVFIDSDGERDPNDIPKLIRKLENSHANMVIGSRNRMRSWSRNFLNGFTVFWVWVLTGFRLKDALSGFVIIKKKALERMELKSRNFEIETEMILEAYKNGLRVVQEGISVPRISRSGCSIKYMLQINAFFDKWVLDRVRNEECGLSFCRQIFLLFFCSIGLVLTKWSTVGNRDA